MGINVSEGNWFSNQNKVADAIQNLNSDGTLTANVTGNLVGSIDTVVAGVAATADGLTTGTITKTGNRTVVNVVSINADYIITLPSMDAGDEVILLPSAATAYELRTSAPATIGINGGTGASAESAIPAGTTVRCIKSSSANIVATSYAANGTVSATEVAA